jgi:hypothetical protein
MEFESQDFPHELPPQPPRLWQKRSRGGPNKGEGPELLFAFLREVYGPYFPNCRNQLRKYLYQHDRVLWDAINDYEHRKGGRKLPPDIEMPTERELLKRLVQRAAKEGLGKLSKAERRTVRVHYWRRQRLELKRRGVVNPALRYSLDPR